MEKVIFHIDVNSAYLSWEAVYRLKQGGTVDLREIPCAVGEIDPRDTGSSWQSRCLLKLVAYGQESPLPRH